MNTTTLDDCTRWPQSITGQSACVY